MAKMSLKEWINSKQKAKGLSTKEAKAGASKYKSISAAKKAGSLYYTNKDGKIMIAATAEDLKSPAPSKSLRPKMRPTSGGSRPAATAKETAEVKKRNAEIKLAERARKDTGPNAARKKRMANKNGSGYLKNKNLDASLTFKKFQGMTNEEKKAAGLPLSMGQTERSFNRYMATRKK
jgi:hypothetical protein